MFLKNNLLNLLLLLISLFYYIIFINKGIVLYDEGYYLHIADRVLMGQIPYKDFFLQFSPTYFYLLALVLKIFGEQIIVERGLIMILCLGIMFLTLKLSEKFGFSGNLNKILIFLAVISYGFPLINNSALLAWVSVFLSLSLIFVFSEWINNKSFKNLLFVALILAAIFSVKQNLGIYFVSLTSIFVFISTKARVLEKAKKTLPLDLLVFAVSSVWIYFIVRNGAFNNFIEFNRRYAGLYPISYPSFSIIKSPLDVLKLVPYYSPVILFLFLLFTKKINKKNIGKIFFASGSVIGFFGTVIPTSDLLHVYPFYGILLVAGLIYLAKTKYYKFWLFLTIISIVLGFYLTLFREYYRYQPGYFKQNTQLNLERAQGIYVDKPLEENLISVNNFIKQKTTAKDYIFVYPFSPMLYFILERSNPSYYSIYYPGYLTIKQEEKVIGELKTKRVRYIITRSDYRFKTPLSLFIQKQKEVYNKGDFKIFEIK